MAVTRIAVSLDPQLAKAIRQAAGRQTTSAWLADAAIRKRRSDGLLGAVREWEAEHGAITEDELHAADRELGRPRR